MAPKIFKESDKKKRWSRRSMFLIAFTISFSGAALGQFFPTAFWQAAWGGTVNYVAKFISSTSAGNSGIIDNGTTVSTSELLSISVNTSSSALTVTQAGAGNAAIFNGGYVGIGTANPTTDTTIGTTMFSVQGSGTSPGLVASQRNANTTNYGTGFASILNNSSGNPVPYTYFNGYIINNTAGSESGGLQFYTRKSGTMTEQMMIDNNGSVGIGTTGPGYNLDVASAITNDSSSQSIAIEGGSDGTLGPLHLGFGTHPSATAGSRYTFISSGDNTGLRPLILNTNGSGLFGNVGIGTTGPAGTLDVENGSGTAQICLNSACTSSLSGSSLWTTSGSNIYNTNSGNVGIGTASPKNPLSVYASTTTGTAANFSGWVGIGTATPSASLEVGGNEQVDGSITSTVDGSSQYNAGDLNLVDSGNGNIWQITNRGASDTGNRNKLLYYYYNGSTWTVPLVIDTSSHVGIGTASPNANLNVVSGSIGTQPAAFIQASTTTTGYINYSTLALANTSGTTNSNVRFAFEDNSSDNINAGIYGIFTDTTNHYGDIAFVSRSAGGLTEKMRVTSTGNVGIGTTAPGEALVVNSSHGNGVEVYNGADSASLYDDGQAHLEGTSGSALWINEGSNLITSIGAGGGSTWINQNGGFVAIGTTSPSYTLDVENSTGGSTVAYFYDGTHHCTVIPNSGVSCSSDERLKTDVETIENVLPKLDLLRGVSFHWKDDLQGEKKIGFIAQEIEKVFPEFVSVGKDGYKDVNYANFVAVLTNAVKELNAKFQSLFTTVADNTTKLLHHDDEIARLKSENAALKSRLDQIERKLNSK